eukprot:1481340-Prymnesium_polylepis.1
MITIFRGGATREYALLLGLQNMKYPSKRDVGMESTVGFVRRYATRYESELLHMMNTSLCTIVQISCRKDPFETLHVRLHAATRISIAGQP